jgi:hypothetical protein
LLPGAGSLNPAAPHKASRDNGIIRHSPNSYRRWPHHTLVRLPRKAWNRGPRISAGFGVNISLSVLSNRFQTHARMIGNFYVFQRWAGTEKAGGAKALDP